MGIMKLSRFGPRFDFDSGALLESPCKRCRLRKLLPDCIKKCELISDVQTQLSGGVSCTMNHAPEETYSIGTLE